MKILAEAEQNETMMFPNTEHGFKNVKKKMNMARHRCLSHVRNVEHFTAVYILHVPGPDLSQATPYTFHHEAIHC